MTAPGNRSQLATSAAAARATRPEQTPAQTVGPFFGCALPWAGGAELVAPWAPGAIRLHGTVYDGAGEPVPDALLEIWQADPHGRLCTEAGALCRDGRTFAGFGRVPTDAAGHYVVHTLRPGAVRAPDGSMQAPHLAMAVFARGLLHHLNTRVYLPEATTANSADVLLASLPTERAATLVAVAEGPFELRFDVRLQGAAETVFLDLSSDPAGAAHGPAAGP